MAGWYGNPIPTWFLYPIDCLKISALEIQYRPVAKWKHLPLILFSEVNHQSQAMSELCVEPLSYEEQPKAIARQLNFGYTFIKNKFKALNTLLNILRCLVSLVLMKGFTISPARATD